MKYIDFLKRKMNIARKFGFDVSDDEINLKLLGHQKDIVKWCLSGGRRAIFAAFGLGKTMMQLEILRIIHKRENGKHLIIAPLGVKQEFSKDAKFLDIEIKFIRRTDEVLKDGIYITNYESVRDGKLDVNCFTSVSLDEASVLRSYGSKTYQNFLTLFGNIKYKFVATATPSPNRFKELIHYSGFLGILDTGACLTMFFQRDSTQANNLTLNPSQESKFWLWLNSWAIFLQRPSDIGHSDDGYVLPPLEVIYHKVELKDKEYLSDRDGQLAMFRDAGKSLQDASREKRESIKNRIEKGMEIINNIK
jgi:hypothetical protein